jgi:hypothetical protein
MDQLTARKLLQRPRGSGAAGSPRLQSKQKHLPTSLTPHSFNWSSHNLNSPQSPLLVGRKGASNHKDSPQSGSAQNSPKLARRHLSKPRPRSMSDDRVNNEDDLFEAVALLSTPVSTKESDQCQIDLEEQTSAIV